MAPKKFLIRVFGLYLVITIGIILLNKHNFEVMYNLFLACGVLYSIIIGFYIFIKNRYSQDSRSVWYYPFVAMTLLSSIWLLVQYKTVILNLIIALFSIPFMYIDLLINTYIAKNINLLLIIIIFIATTIFSAIGKVFGLFKKEDMLIFLDSLLLIIPTSILILILNLNNNFNLEGTFILFWYEISSYVNLVMVALLWQTMMTLYIYFEPKFFDLASLGSSELSQQTQMPSITEESQEPGVLDKI